MNNTSVVAENITGYLTFDKDEDFLFGFDSEMKEEFVQLFCEYFPQMVQKTKEEKNGYYNVRELYDRYKSEISLRVSIKKMIQKSLIEFSEKHPRKFKVYRALVSRNIFRFKEKVVQTIRVCFQDPESVLSAAWSKETLIKILDDVFEEIA